MSKINASIGGSFFIKGYYHSPGVTNSLLRGKFNNFTTPDVQLLNKCDLIVNKLHNRGMARTVGNSGGNYEYKPPANWQEIVAAVDPFIKFTCTNWRQNIHVVDKQGDVFCVTSPSNDALGVAMFTTAGARNEAKIDHLVEFMQENFLKDDDALTGHRPPWSREMLYRRNDHDLLSVSAVLAGVKPSALISDDSIFDPNVRVAMTRLDKEWLAADFVGIGNRRCYAVGKPESVFQIKEAFKIRKDSETRGR
jgi:hypothetical protein